MRVRAVVAGGLALLVVAVLAALASSAPRLAGTNELRVFHRLTLPAGATLCQGPEFLPGHSGRVRIYAHPGTVAGPPLGVELRDGGRVVARGRAEGGYADGAIVVPLSGVDGPETVDEVCIENRGERAVELGGQTIGPDLAARVDGELSDGRLRLEWLRPGSESWLELAPAVAHRFGFGKADWLGSWTLWLAAALVLAAWAAAARLLLGRRR